MPEKRPRREIIFVVALGLVNVIVFGWRTLAPSVTPPEYNAGEESESVTPTAIKTPVVSKGLTVIHCRETDAMRWLLEMPWDDWKVTVYETCDEDVRVSILPEYPEDSIVSRAFRNRGSEECTSYLDFIVQNYDRLPDVSVFMHADGVDKHSPFQTAAELARTVERFFATDSSRGFLHFGLNAPNFETWVETGDSYLQHYLHETWVEDMGLPVTSDTFVQSRPGACFAVHIRRIRARPREVYARLLQRILRENDKSIARKRCCALENVWHVLFGEPHVIPVESTMDFLYDERHPQPKFNLTLSRGMYWDGTPSPSRHARGLPLALSGRGMNRHTSSADRRCVQVSFFSARRAPTSVPPARFGLGRRIGVSSQLLSEGSAIDLGRPTLTSRRAATGT